MSSSQAIPTGVPPTDVKVENIYERLKIQNVVSTANLNTKLNLKQLAL